jgi:hypothetical protein
MRCFPARGFFVLGFFLAITLLCFGGGSVQSARAGVSPTHNPRIATGPIGLGFNYPSFGVGMIAVAYAPPGSGTPPAPVIQGVKAYFYPAISLGAGGVDVTGTYSGTGAPQQDKAEAKPGSLYLFVQCSNTTACAQKGSAPLNLRFSYSSGGPGIMVVYSKNGLPPHQCPPGYSSNDLELGKGINAVWDGQSSAATPTQTAPNRLFVFLRCPGGVGGPSC